MWLHWKAIALASLLMLVAGSLAASERRLEHFPQRQARQSALFLDNQTGQFIARGGQADGATYHESGDVSIGASAGISSGPTGFLATGEADFWFSRIFSVGPLVQISAGRSFVFAASGGPKITFDFGEHEFSQLVKPYAQAGAGVALISNRRGGRNRSELGLLLLFGLGVDFYLTEDFSLGSGLLFNIMPTEPRGELFYVGWKIIEAKFHF